jgi:hypothetical protein
MIFHTIAQVEEEGFIRVCRMEYIMFFIFRKYILALPYHVAYECIHERCLEKHGLSPTPEPCR